MVLVKMHSFAFGISFFGDVPSSGNRQFEYTIV